MTREDSKVAVVNEWNRLPTWRRRNSQDAAEFAQIMLTSRPDLTDFDCPFDRFLVLRAWLLAEQRTVEQGKKSTSRKRATTGKKPAVVAVEAAI